MKAFQKITDWYLTRNALPYWYVLLTDLAVCYLAGLFTFWIYFREALTPMHMGMVTRTVLFYMIFSLVGFRVFHTYAGVMRYSSFVDLRRVAMAMGLSFFIAIAAHYTVYTYRDLLPVGLIRHLASRQILVMYVMATAGMWLLRVGVKNMYDISLADANSLRTFIYGAGGDGVGMGKHLRNMKPTRFRLEGYISSREEMRGKNILGLTVHADDDLLPHTLHAAHIQAVIISPTATDDFRANSHLQDILITAGIKIYMPGDTHEWGEGEGRQPQMHEIHVEDLLPRAQIKTDTEATGRLLTGQRILITGSAGSIGSEIVRQVAAYKPAELMLIDLAETPQHDIRLMMRTQWPDIKTTTLVGTITDRGRMERVFREFKPHYVFHAAAYKHVPMMEDNPTQAILNNVAGTRVVADLSVKYGVRKFVMLSTDKAVNPTNVMGCSKRICEIYVQSLDRAVKTGAVSAPAQTQFVTTRFGNVLGSNGSVIPTFERQIQAGGPVTVTHPDIIRYFMLIPEACQLVLEAGTHGKGGEIFVFDMGKPVRIADLARRMVALSGRKDVKIAYTGLRPGEKLYEELISCEEDTLPSFHPKIRIARVREYDYAEVASHTDGLVAQAAAGGNMETVGLMKKMVPEYKSQNSVYAQLDQ